MIAAFSTPHNRTRKLSLVFISALLSVAAAAVGIDDHPPGILLAYLAAIAFVLAFVLPWQFARQFGILLAASVLGIPLFVILNNLFAAAGHNPSTAVALQYLFQGLAVAAFFLATLIFPAAFLVGAARLVFLFICSRRRPN
jgi:hypothetical protein